MSTFLELCSDLRREAGISGAGPTTVVSQTGEMGRVVEWVKKAYRDLQNLHANWDFLKTEFSFSTIASTANYTKTAAGLTELGSWKVDEFTCYLTATGVADEQPLEYVPWDDFKAGYTLGTLSTQTNRPQVVTVKPDQSLTFWPIPNDVYTIKGEYYKRAQAMTVNSDEPLIPLAFQDVIVWRALMFYGAYTGADEKYSHGQNEFKRLLAKLEENQLPAMMLGEPLV